MVICPIALPTLFLARMQRLGLLRGDLQRHIKPWRRSQRQLYGSAWKIRETKAGGFLERLVRGILPLTVEYLGDNLRLAGISRCLARSPFQRKGVVGIRAAVGHGDYQFVVISVIGNSGKRVAMSDIE
jgi:hypothetical protein